MYDFFSFGNETYDLMAPRTSALLYRLADIASTNVDSLDVVNRDTCKSHKGRPNGPLHKVDHIVETSFVSTNQDFRRSTERGRMLLTPTLRRHARDRHRRAGTLEDGSS